MTRIATPRDERHALTGAGGGHYRARFERWKENNPHAMALFRRFAKEAASRRRRYSIWAVASRARWEATFQTMGDDFKVNNSLLAYIARDLMEDGTVPEGFFSTRTLRAG
jgi:hypothetical protein